LAHQAVGVLVGAALPWAVRVCEVERDPDLDPERGVIGATLNQTGAFRMRAN
jgi:hypothetical protein